MRKLNINNLWRLNIRLILQKRSYFKLIRARGKLMLSVTKTRSRIKSVFKGFNIFCLSFCNINPFDPEFFIIYIALNGSTFHISYIGCNFIYFPVTEYKFFSLYYLNGNSFVSSSLYLKFFKSYDSEIVLEGHIKLILGVFG